jgi:hypothetical protein
MSAFSAPDERLNKILRMLGVDTNKAISVDIHIAVNEAVTLKIEQYANWDQHECEGFDLEKETVLYRLEPIIDQLEEEKKND